MNDRELFIQRRRAEHPIFQRVLKALPKDKLDYKPHERSPSAAQILTTMAHEQAACARLVATGRTEWAPPPPGTYDEMVEAFEREWKALDEGVAGLDDAGWDKVGEFMSKGKAYPGQPIGQFLWFILFDAVHHRGQLTTYIRPMGGRVPAVYGPSADERPPAG